MMPAPAIDLNADDHPPAQEHVLQAAAMLDLGELVRVFDWPPVVTRQG